LPEDGAVPAIDEIRWSVREREYHLSSHAEDEMADDGLERPDVEHAILHGFVQRKMTRDPRGTRYRIEGPARDGRLMHVVCRFHEVGTLLIITVYAKR